MSARVGKDPMLLAEVARRLRAAREARGWSLSAAAFRSGQVTDVALGTYERGDRTASLYVLMHLAELYGVPVASLVPGLGAGDHSALMRAASSIRAEAERVLAAIEDDRAVRVEMADARARIDAVLDVARAAEHEASRWEDPLPVPGWVKMVRDAAGHPKDRCGCATCPTAEERRAEGRS